MANKNGLWAIGYIENSFFCLREIANLAGVEMIDAETFSSYIDEQWADRYNKVICYGNDFEKVDSASDEIRFFLLDSGLKKANSDESIYCAFYCKSYDTTVLEEKERGWVGVVIGSENDILNQMKDGSFTKNKTAFEQYTTIQPYIYNNIADYLSKKTGAKTSINDAKQYVNGSFENAAENDTLLVCDEGHKKNHFSYFPLLVPDYTKENLYIKMIPNKKSQEGGPVWYGATIVTEEYLVETLIEAKLDSKYCRIGTLVFDDFTDMTGFLAGIANKAMKEKWHRGNSDKAKVVGQYSVLKSYIEHTYLRLAEEDRNRGEDTAEKIVRFKEKVYFNTGLLDRYFRQIFIVGDTETIVFEHPYLECRRIEVIKNAIPYSENESAIARIFSKNNLPAIATYFKKREDVVFDASLDISLNDHHIFVDGVRRGRLPKYQKDFEECGDDERKLDSLITRMTGEFDQACARAKLLAERNYKLAGPQYWEETGEIQFLLPIYLDDSEAKPVCAIALSLDTEGINPYYRGETILTLDMAYNNARLIVKPDVYWLNDAE